MDSPGSRLCRLHSLAFVGYGHHPPPHAGVGRLAVKLRAHAVGADFMPAEVGHELDGLLLRPTNALRQR